MQTPPHEMDPHKPQGQSTWQHTLGAGLLGAGVALGMCRLALLPFGQGTSTISIVIGLATGLMVAGIFQMRAAQPKAPTSTLALAFLVAGAMTVGAFFAIYPPPPALAELGLARQTLPGLRALLPDQEASPRNVDAHCGMIKYERPSDLSGAISLEWQPGEAWTQQDVDLVAQTLRDALDPNAQILTALRPVAEQAGYQITFSNDRMEMRGVLWTCPEDGRLFTLWCGFSADAKDVQALFDRLVAGLACTAPPSQAQGDTAALSSLPAIDLPGFGVLEVAGYVQLGSLDGDILLVQHNRSGKLGTLLTQKPELLEKVLSGFAGQEGMRLDFDRTPRRVSGADGRERPLWLIDATTEGERVFMAVSVLDCDASRSYLLMALRSDGDDPGNESESRKLLAAVTCPRPGAKPLPKFESMAQQACDTGDARGCFQLADLYQTADPNDPRAAGLLEKACKLGLAEACPQEGP